MRIPLPRLMLQALAFAACLWSLAFAAPHAWWALGISTGFPGGEASYRRFMGSAWRYWYDVGVFGCALLGAAVALELGRSEPPGGRDRHRGRREVARRLASLAASALLLRGVAGLVVDGRADLIWWPTFLLGGILFGTLVLATWPRAAIARSGAV
jgi:hypothetical protein